MLKQILQWLCLFQSGWFHTAKAQELENQYGVLVVEETAEKQTENPDNDHLFCVVYYPSIRNISEKENPSKYSISKILDLGDANTCNDGDQLEDVEGKIGYINTNTSIANCSIAERAARLQEFEALGLISDRVLQKFNGSDFNISIEVFTLVERNAKERMLKFQQDYPQGSFYLYSTKGDDRSFDLSLVVILLMAVSTVILGSLWSGYAKQSLRMKKERESSTEYREEDPNSVQPQDGSGGQEEELSVQVSPLLVLFFVCCMCSMLVLLYFFFNQLVYVIMTMFCIASSLAMYSCLEPLVMASYQIPCLPVLRLPRCNLYLCVLQLELRQLVLLVASIGTAATWFAFRKTDWSWIIQDILGIMFSINMLKVLRLPSLKICTILLSALFFYDIFFVFITPLFMEGGKSVMVEVATGHSSDEQLPMVLRVPHLSTDPSRVCYVNTYSLLGFGDILVPGLLLSFAHSYDLLTGIKYKLYWIITTVAYILGLIATFISLFVMNSAQPALLYLVPFTLIPTILVAWIRGDLASMWEGDIKAADRKFVPKSSALEENNPGLEVEEDQDNDEDNTDDDIDDAKDNLPNEQVNETSQLPDQDNLISTPDKNKLLGN